MKIKNILPVLALLLSGTSLAVTNICPHEKFVQKNLLKGVRSFDVGVQYNIYAEEVRQGDLVFESATSYSTPYDSNVACYYKYKDNADSLITVSAIGHCINAGRYKIHNPTAWKNDPLRPYHNSKLCNVSREVCAFDFDRTQQN